MREVAAASKGLTSFGAAMVILTEVVSSNEASEIMVGIALRSAGRTLILSAGPAYVTSYAFQYELDLFDRAVTSTANDIYKVLSKSREGW